MDLDPIDSPQRGEHQQIGVGRTHKQVFDKILIPRDRRHNTASPAALRAIQRGCRPLDIAGVGNGDDHVFFGNQVFDRQVGAGGQNLGAAGVAETHLEVLQLLADERVYFTRVGQNVFQLLDQANRFGVLVDDFSLLQLGQALEAHVQNSLGLDLAQHEAGGELTTDVGRILTGADELNHRVQVIQGDF